MKTEHHSVRSRAEPNIQIYLRERYAEDRPPESAARVVLFVHGATYPGVVFDCPVGDYSWMNRAVADGFVAYAMDVRGYGRSTRPPAMDQPPTDNPPFARASEVVPDIDDVIEFIFGRTAAEQIYLVGHSWGTVTTGMYATRHGDKIARLVLFAPVFSGRHDGWIANIADPKDPSCIRADLGAYRLTTRQGMTDRWMAQLTPGNITDMLEDEALAGICDEILASDPAADDHAPPAIRSPNGVLVDVYEIFSDRPIYDPAKITVPTLVIRGTDDTDSTRGDAMGLFDRLGAAERRYVEIARASHFVLLEKNVNQLHDEVARFFAD